MTARWQSARASSEDGGNSACVSRRASVTSSSEASASLLTRLASVQTVEEIEAIVKEAQIPAGQQHAKPANVEDDAYLDSMMDKMGA